MFPSTQFMESALPVTDFSRTDLRFEWTAGSGDYVVVHLQGEKPGSAGQFEGVACFVQDDGEFTLSGSDSSKVPEGAPSLRIGFHRVVLTTSETSVGTTLGIGIASLSKSVAN